MTVDEVRAKVRAQRDAIEARKRAAVVRAREHAPTEPPPPQSRFRVFVHHFGGNRRTVFCWTDRRVGSWRWKRYLSHVELAADVDDLREFRERMLEELRPGVFAMWSDVRERWAA